MTYIVDSRYSRFGAGPAGALSGPVHFVLRIRQTLNMWYDRTLQRRHLVALDDHLLRDIGIDRASALKEASKSFWR